MKLRMYIHILEEKYILNNDFTQQFLNQGNMIFAEVGE